MPTIPQKVKLNGSSADIINATRNELGDEFADRVPQAYASGQLMENGVKATPQDARQRLNEIGNIIMTFEPLQNSFLSALVNRIGRVIITSKMYDNPWVNFKKGMLEYGETVEEIFVKIASPHQFDPETAENEIFKMEIPDVLATFHSMNFQKYYKTTVRNDELRQAFLNYNGITDLIGRIIDSLYTGANYDEFITMKYLTSKMLIQGALATFTTPIVTELNARSVVTTMKAASNKLEYMSSDYNYANVETHTPKSDQYFIMTSDFNALIDVEVLALSFNMSKAEFMGRIIGVDSFAPTPSELKRLALLFKDDPTYVQFTAAELTLLKEVNAIIIDKDWFMIFDNFFNMTENYNGQGLYWNYWYHVWKTFSISPYANAISFSITAPTVTNVAVNPSTVSMPKGSNLRLTAKVTTTGLASKKVVWSISGGSTATSITQDGLLTIGMNETGTSAQITATSVLDPTKFGVCVLTIT